MSKVLVVEDEKAIADILAFNLERSGFSIEVAYDGLDGLSKAMRGDVDLILLDVMLPHMDGFNVCTEIRKSSNVPIIMLTAREEEVDKVFGLEVGADDYMVKPFSMQELLARVKANIRRRRMDGLERKEENILASGFCFDKETCSVKKDGDLLELTLREHELLHFLHENEGKVFSREELLEKVWHFEFLGDVRTVDVTVRRLREKIEADPSNPKHLLTKRGYGYFFLK